MTHPLVTDRTAAELRPGDRILDWPGAFDTVPVVRIETADHGWPLVVVDGTGLPASAPVGVIVHPAHVYRIGTDTVIPAQYLRPGDVIRHAGTLHTIAAVEDPYRTAGEPFFAVAEDPNGNRVGIAYHVGEQVPIRSV
jgi:hypothetical protein